METIQAISQIALLVDNIRSYKLDIISIDGLYSKIPEVHLPSRLFHETFKTFSAAPFNGQSFPIELYVMFGDVKFYTLETEEGWYND